MSSTLSQLAALVQGKVIGPGETIIDTALPLSESTKGSITFLESEKYLTKLAGSSASAVVIPATIKFEGKPAIQVADPLSAFVEIVKYFQGNRQQMQMGIDPRAAVHPQTIFGDGCRIDPYAVIHEGCVLGQRCQIHSQVVIGRNCKLGDDVVLYPGVVLYDNTILGDRVIVHSNSVLGADGFGYRFQQGKHNKIPQLGFLEIGADVEIGACTTIDRGTFHATRIGEGTKIDNLVQIGHNCQIGQHNLLVSQLGIAGSSSTGSYVVIAGQVGIVDHAHIGDGAMIGAKAGVTKDVPPRQRMLGAPATPERDQKRILMSLEKLPEMRRDLKRIKQILNIEGTDEAAA